MNDRLPFQELDSESCALYLEVPQSQVVLLQSYFELYEGIGIVRTIDPKRPLLCLLMTKSQAENCSAALESIRGQVQWRAVSGVPAEAANP